MQSDREITIISTEKEVPVDVQIELICESILTLLTAKVDIA